jgi:hypothetical protein
MWVEWKVVTICVEHVENFISLETIITCHQCNLLSHEEPWPKSLWVHWYHQHWTTLVLASHPPHCKTAFLGGIQSLSEPDQSHKNSGPDGNSIVMPLFYLSMVVLYPRLSKFSHPDNVFLDMTNTLKSLIPTSTANLCVNQCLSTSNNDFTSSTCWSRMIHYPANQHHNLSSIISECGMVMHCYHILSAGCTNILSHQHVPPMFRSNLFKLFQHVLGHSVMTYWLFWLIDTVSTTLQAWHR